MTTGFDWRIFQESGPHRLRNPRPSHWPELRLEIDVTLRYQNDVYGYAEWMVLIDDLKAIIGGKSLSSLSEVFDRFLLNIDNSTVPPKKPTCVFISHQRIDSYLAERVACIVSHMTDVEIEYWLDVHDPILKWLNGRTIPANVYPIFIAAIVEIALLNSTHVIALHTKFSRLSRWVPYELGRAKARGIVGHNAAGWFAPPKRHSLRNCGEYVLLAETTYSEQEVRDWLRTAAGGGTGSPISAGTAATTSLCALHKTAPLP